MDGQRIQPLWGLYGFMIRFKLIKASDDSNQTSYNDTKLTELVSNMSQLNEQLQSSVESGVSNEKVRSWRFALLTPGPAREKQGSRCQVFSMFQMTLEELGEHLSFLNLSKFFEEPFTRVRHRTNGCH